MGKAAPGSPHGFRSGRQSWCVGTATASPHRGRRLLGCSISVPTDGWKQVSESRAGRSPSSRSASRLRYGSEGMTAAYRAPLPNRRRGPNAGHANPADRAAPRLYRRADRRRAPRPLPPRRTRRGRRFADAVYSSPDSILCRSPRRAKITFWDRRALAASSSIFAFRPTRLEDGCSPWPEPPRRMDFWRTRAEDLERACCPEASPCSPRPGDRFSHSALRRTACARARPARLG